MLELVDRDFKTAFRVGEAHFEQTGDQTAGRDVVSGEDEALVDEFLNGVEGIAEIFGVLHRWHVGAHEAAALCEGRTGETEVVEGEVDVIERCVLVVDNDRRHHLADVAHLTAGADDDRSRRDDLLAVGVLL